MVSQPSIMKTKNPRWWNWLHQKEAEADQLGEAIHSSPADEIYEQSAELLNTLYYNLQGWKMGYGESTKEWEDTVEHLEGLDKFESVIGKLKRIQAQTGDPDADPDADPKEE